MKKPLADGGIVSFQPRRTCKGDNSHLQFRQFDTGADVEAWISLHQRAFEGAFPSARPWSVERFRQEDDRKLSAHGWSGWVAVLKLPILTEVAIPPTLVVGSVFLITPDVSNATTQQGTAKLSWLMVDPDHRRKGIARNLLHLAQMKAVEMGNDFLSLECHTSWRAAISFYLAEGFHIEAAS